MCVAIYIAYAQVPTLGHSSDKQTETQLGDADYSRFIPSVYPFIDLSIDLLAMLEESYMLSIYRDSFRSSRGNAECIVQSKGCSVLNLRFVRVYHAILMLTAVLVVDKDQSDEDGTKHEGNQDP